MKTISILARSSHPRAGDGDACTGDCRSSRALFGAQNRQPGSQRLFTGAMIRTQVTGTYAADPYVGQLCTFPQYHRICMG